MNQKYNPGLEVSGNHWIKLHRNENLFVDEEWLKKVGIDSMRALNLSQYPDPNCNRLRERLGQIYNVDPECIFVGNGSDEVLAILLQWLRSKFSEAITPALTYRVYPLLFQRYDYKHLTLDDASKRRLCLIDSPNSLTGETIEIFNIPSGFLIWDNIYGEFSKDELNLSQIDSSTVIIRSFSKFYGLANLRIGYCIADAEIIQALMKQKDIYNVNGFAQEMALRALENKDRFDALIPKIAYARNALREGLKSMGFTVSDAKANSVWITHPTVPAELLREHLEKSHILVRRFSEPNLSNYLRITVPPLDIARHLLDMIKKLI